MTAVLLIRGSRGELDAVPQHRVRRLLAYRLPCWCFLPRAFVPPCRIPTTSLYPPPYAYPFITAGWRARYATTYPLPAADSDAGTDTTPHHTPTPHAAATPRPFCLCCHHFLRACLACLPTAPQPHCRPWSSIFAIFSLYFTSTRRKPGAAFSHATAPCTWAGTHRRTCLEHRHSPGWWRSRACGLAA